MTVYTGNPFGGFGGFGGGMRNPRMPRPMPRPPMNRPQMPPMNQMPRRMPGGPSKGGTTSIPMPRRGGAPWGGYNPNAGFPGGPGKARNRGQSRGGSWFGGGMPGGPGKARNPSGPNMSGYGGFLQGPVGEGMTSAPPQFGNNPPPQPDQTMGRPMPQPFQPAVDLSSKQRGGPRFGINMPKPPGFNQMPNVPPQPDFGQIGQIGQPQHKQISFGGGYGQAPMMNPMAQQAQQGFFGQLQSMPYRPNFTPPAPMQETFQNPFAPTAPPRTTGEMRPDNIQFNQYGGRGFYGGGIMDLYPR